MRRVGSTPSAVLFDLGNTLVNYHVGGLSDEEKDAAGYQRAFELLRSWDLPVAEPEVLTGLRRRIEALWAGRAERDAESPLEPLIRDLLPSGAGTEDRVRELIQALHAPWREHAVAYVWIAPADSGITAGGAVHVQHLSDVAAVLGL